MFHVVGRLLRKEGEKKKKEAMLGVNVAVVNGGEGETSYSNNSTVQKTAILKVRPFVEEIMEDLFSSATFPVCFNVADLGSSSGPNALLVVSELLDAAHKICQKWNIKFQHQEFQVFLNDLPSNDFNCIFRSTPDFYVEVVRKYGAGRCFIAGTPGTFYDRLFPSRSMHFVHSSYSIQWLSKVPENLEDNKRNIYVGQSSPPSVHRAYFEQFRRDFSSFLHLRSDEIVCGGHMLLYFVGRSSADPLSCRHLWELLSKSLLELVNEAGVDSFNLPWYLPSMEEVNLIVKNQGSFSIQKLEMFGVKWDPSSCSDDDDDDDDDDVKSNERCGINVAKSIRAVTEPLLATHFGDAIIEPLFATFAKLVSQHLAKDKKTNQHVTIILSTTKK